MKSSESLRSLPGHASFILQYTLCFDVKRLFSWSTVNGEKLQIGKGFPMVSVYKMASHDYVSTDHYFDLMFHTYMHTYIHTYIHTYVHTHIACMLAYKHSYINRYIDRYIDTFLLTYMNTYIHTYNLHTNTNIHTYIHAGMHAYGHTYIHTYIYMNALHIYSLWKICVLFDILLVVVDRPPYRSLAAFWVGHKSFLGLN